MRSAFKICLVALLVGAPVVAGAQGGATIPEALARAGTSLTGGTTIPSGPAPSLSKILADVDLVVRGSIGEGRSYLSEDQTEVFTDHLIENPVILYRREVVASERPGKVSPVTVTVQGGTISINGLTYTSVVGALDPLKPGTEGLFLLNHKDKRHFIAGESYGVFQVTDGRLKPLTKKHGFAKEYAGAEAVSGQHAILAELRWPRK